MRWTMPDMDTSNPPDSAALFLRPDGTLTLIRGQSMVELHLQPAQLLLLAADAMRAALHLDPTLRPELDAAVAEWQREVSSEAPVCPQH
jgi:hypothetical protein